MLSDYRNPNYISRTWLVTPAQAIELAQIAENLGCGYSALVRYALAWFLAEHRAGHVKLHTRPARYELLDYEPPF